MHLAIVTGRAALDKQKVVDGEEENPFWRKGKRPGDVEGGWERRRRVDHGGFDGCTARNAFPSRPLACRNESTVDAATEGAKAVVGLGEMPSRRGD